jgi:uncharacterized protein (DUF1800 family)
MRGATWWRAAAFATATLVVSACSGGGGDAGDVPGPDPPESLEQSSRFLTQATFGPNKAAIDRLAVIGYTAWFDEQRARKPSLHRPPLEAQNPEFDQAPRVNLWWYRALRSPDQLRQRVAFALSEILVVSDASGGLEGQPVQLAEYYDVLVRNALGSYRELLEQVTLSPAMGQYLSMLRNRKADPAFNIRPDENYAREVMQLFTVGLVQLAPDGTPLLDGQGATLPTYGQAEVEALARVFTGWNYADALYWDWTPNPTYAPMEPWEQYHDTAPKTLLGGHFIPGGLTAREDVEAALDALVAHPNVGPFVSKQLIQRLVTSNPTPAYVARVAAVFADNGAGERGDLFAVVRAILMDDEARHGHENMPTTFGKVREPLLRQTALWRAFDATSSNGAVAEAWPEQHFGQAPLRSPSVFNFFQPHYAPPGVAAQAGLAAPELQIATDNLVTQTSNVMLWRTLFGWEGNPWSDSDDTLLQLDYELSIAHDTQALLEHLDLVLMSGAMSSEMRTAIAGVVDAYAPGERIERVVDALYLIVTSPEFCVQK